MNLSTTTAICSSACLVILGVVTVLHNRKVFDWIRRTRRTDDAAKDLHDVDDYLKSIHELLCTFAQKPSTAADFDPLRTLRNVMEDYAAQSGALRTELRDVVVRCDAYLGTGLRPPVAGSRTELMEAAMQQEHARTRLCAAVSDAQQRVRTLRRL